MKKKNKDNETPKVVVPKATTIIDGRIAYVFTNWGLVKGQVIAERIDRNTGCMQYKLDVCNFWYNEDQLHKGYFMTLVKELIKLLF